MKYLQHMIAKLELQELKYIGQKIMISTTK